MSHILAWRAAATAAQGLASVAGLGKEGRGARFVVASVAPGKQTVEAIAALYIAPIATSCKERSGARLVLTNTSASLGQRAKMGAAQGVPLMTSPGV